MLRRRVTVLAAAGATVLACVAITPATATASTSPVSLVVPQATAFTVLGHSCGGIRERNYVSQFDPATGYPDGDAYLTTSCSCGKACSTTYKAWVSTTWDFTAALVSYAVLSATPTVNPTLSVFDSHGNHIYNRSTFAYLVLAPGFIPAPRVAGLAPASAPQGTSITITGTGFTGATAVAFGLYSAVSFTVNGATSITAIAPAVRTGTVPVRVTGPGGTSAKTSRDLFTFTLRPRISSLSPSSGSADGGTQVTISGVNFAGATVVQFGGVAASFKVISATSITAFSPSAGDPVTVDVTVSSSYGTSAISVSDRFTYI
jgi:IPT/TIG domain-containing protein